MPVPELFTRVKIIKYLIILWYVTSSRNLQISHWFFFELNTPKLLVSIRKADLVCHPGVLCKKVFLIVEELVETTGRVTSQIVSE